MFRDKIGRTSVRPAAGQWPPAQKLRPARPLPREPRGQFYYRSGRPTRWRSALLKEVRRSPSYRRPTSSRSMPLCDFKWKIRVSNSLQSSLDDYCRARMPTTSAQEPGGRPDRDRALPKRALDHPGRARASFSSGLLRRSFEHLCRFGRRRGRRYEASGRAALVVPRFLSIFHPDISLQKEN